MLKTGHSLARDREKKACKEIIRISILQPVFKNKDANLNIDNMVSLEQSTRVKAVMWLGSKPDVRVPDQKENIALLKQMP